MKEHTYTLPDKKLKILFKWNFFKKDLVFTISLFLAIISSLLHEPKLHYIDFKVLVSLFNLMLVVKAFEELKLLDKLAVYILKKCQTSKKVSAVLIFLCFFTSMFVTNDVALLTFVPLTLIIHKTAEINVIETIILQTMAANLGSSLTPMGNPQNLYIFSYYGIHSMQFFSAIFLLAVLGILSLYFLIQRLKNRSLEVSLPSIWLKDRRKSIVWISVFCITTASILGVISYVYAFIITVAAGCILEIKLLRKIDYLLLLTFICFFIFVGNLSDINLIHHFVSESLKKPISIYFTSIFLSQLISNVPASILLSKFTADWQPLLMGVNIGGLGTLIASLASVISYKLFVKRNPHNGKEYLKKFTLYNFLTLAFLTFFQYLFIFF